MYTTIRHEPRHTRRAWPGTLVDPCLLSDPEFQVFSSYCVRYWTGEVDPSFSLFHLSVYISEIAIQGHSYIMRKRLHRTWLPIYYSVRYGSGPKTLGFSDRCVTNQEPIIARTTSSKEMRSPNLQTFEEPRNRFQWIDSLCSPRVRYVNPFLTYRPAESIPWNRLQGS